MRPGNETAHGKVGGRWQTDRLPAHSTPAELFLPRLNRVKHIGKNHGICSCPGPNHAHGDRHPSMTWRINDENALLLFCNVGCSIYEIVAAVGLEVSDLFPRRQHHGKPSRPYFPAADVLAALSHEAIVIASCGRTILNKAPFTESDQERLVLAVHRVEAAITAGGLRHG
jgi:hypothetical protein